MPSVTFARHFARVLLIASGAIIVSATAVRADTTSAEHAAILPVISQTLGNATGGYGGYTVTANGVTDYWSTVKSGTITLVVFVFPGAEVTQDITLTVYAPNGTTQVYAYTFKAQKIPVIGSWFTFPAEGDYSLPGNYSVVVTANGAEVGRIPLVLAPAST
jgi:hypothetical protein